MSEKQHQTNTKIEEMGDKITHLSTVMQELSSNMGEIMKWIMKEKSNQPEDETSKQNGGKESPNSSLIVHQNTTHTEGEGSVNPPLVNMNHDTARNLQFNSKDHNQNTHSWAITSTPPHNQNNNLPPLNNPYGFNQHIEIHAKPPFTQPPPFQTPPHNHNSFHPNPIHHQQNHFTQNYGPRPNQGYQYPMWSQSVEAHNNRGYNPFGPLKIPKMDFPRFEGKDPRGWVNKCEKIFLLNPYMESKTKVLYATLYLDGEADIWFQTV